MQIEREQFAIIVHAWLCLPRTAYLHNYKQANERKHESGSGRHDWFRCTSTDLFVLFWLTGWLVCVELRRLWTELLNFFKFLFVWVSSWEEFSCDWPLYTDLTLLEGSPHYPIGTICLLYGPAGHKLSINRSQPQLYIKSPARSPGWGKYFYELGLAGAWLSTPIGRVHRSSSIVF